MWWRRRTPRVLGAPPFNRKSAPYSLGLVILISLLGLLLPFLGITLVAVLLVERWLLRYIPTTRDFLGLT
jgi:uncharacterized iron-regulated membrane protein